jgi:uncharacterized membrane protein YgdD (TMEM256/DUF423 family)
MNSARTWLLIGALSGGLAVACGAFGAHGLKSRFAADGSLSEIDQQQLANWETAARYQIYHALALVAVGLMACRGRSTLMNLAGGAFTVGTVIFSGCLYVLVLSGQRWLGAVVPIGGSLLILGWIALAIAAWRISGQLAAGDAAATHPARG